MKYNLLNVQRRTHHHLKSLRKPSKNKQNKQIFNGCAKKFLIISSCTRSLDCRQLHMWIIIVALFWWGGISMWHLLERPFVFLFIRGLEQGGARGGTSCGPGKRHSNRWLDAKARGPLVFFLFFCCCYPPPSFGSWNQWFQFGCQWEQRFIIGWIT